VIGKQKVVTIFGQNLLLLSLLSVVLNLKNHVKELYAKMSGRNISKCGFLTSKIEKWLGYSPDGKILDSKNYPSKLLEINCPFKGATLDIIK